AVEVRRLVANRILMTKFQRDLFEDVIHLSAAARIERFTARHTGEFIEDALAFHSQCAANVAAAENTDRVKYHFGFFQDSAQFVEGVTRVIVLAVANQEQRALRVRASLYALDAEIAGIVERRVVFRLHERELVQYGIAVARAIHQQLRARVEANQEIFVTVVASLNEVGQSIARAANLLTAHRTGHIEQNPYRDRRIFIAEESNVLLRLIIKNIERVLAQSRNETPVDIGNGHIESDEIRVRNYRILFIDFTLRQQNLCRWLLRFVRWCLRSGGLNS